MCVKACPRYDVCVFLLLLLLFMGIEFTQVVIIFIRSLANSHIRLNMCLSNLFVVAFHLVMNILVPLFFRVNTMSIL